MMLQTKEIIFMSSDSNINIWSPLLGDLVAFNFEKLKSFVVG